jgi:hypothetical protein
MTVHASLAQQVERVLGKNEVTGSSPVGSSQNTRKNKHLQCGIGIVAVPQTSNLETRVRSSHTARKGKDCANSPPN